MEIVYTIAETIVRVLGTILMVAVIFNLISVNIESLRYMLGKDDK